MLYGWRMPAFSPGQHLGSYAGWLGWLAALLACLPAQQAGPANFLPSHQAPRLSNWSGCEQWAENARDESDDDSQADEDFPLHNTWLCHFLNCFGGKQGFHHIAKVLAACFQTQLAHPSALLQMTSMCMVA